MRRLLLSLLLVFSMFLTGVCQNIGIGTTALNPSAQLDVTSSTKGFLPPRVALTATNVAAPVVNPAAGLLVYNTATAGGTPINVSPGYYYWNGTSWYPVVNKGNTNGDMQYWDGTKWVLIPLGLNGQKLTICNGIPKWGDCSTTITMAPSNNQYEGLLSLYDPNAWQGNYPQVIMVGWTNGGSPFNIRECIKFDYSSIPPGAIIDTARLYLYADLEPENGNKVDAHFGPTNSCYIKRITTNWTTPNQFTWNNPPTTTTTNQAIIPQSTSSFNDNIIDVTALVKDMVTNGNNGFLIGLQNEVTYNSRQYYSSFSTDPLKHPKIIITYH